MAAASAARKANNFAYLNAAYRKKAVCPPASGAGVNQNYTAGQTLIFDVPTANGAFLESVLIECALTVTNAAGTGATYALTAGAPYTLFDTIVIEYNGIQCRLRPIFLKWLAQLQGYERSQPSQVNSGQTVSWLQNTIWGSPFGVASGANTWNFWFRLPLRMLPRSAAGMLPIMGDSTKCQVKVVCASAALGATLNGADPIFNALAWTAGTGQSSAVTGTVAAIAEYRDGSTLFSTAPMGLVLDGEPSVQYYIDSQLNPLTAATILRKRLDTKLPHLYVVSVVIDGNQSNKFTANTNLQALELDQDFNGQNAFYRVGTNGSNISVPHFFEEIQDNFIGQSLDEGVIPWVPGPGYLGVNPDNMEGSSYLNMGPGGWTDASYGIQVGSVVNTAITPRVETYEVSLQPLGLVRS